MLQKDTVLNVVEEVVDIEGKILRYQCRASSEEGHPCSYAQVNFVAGNFKRHLLSCHTKVAGELEFAPKDEPPTKKLRISKLTVDTSRRDVLLGILELATGDSLPLWFPEWNGIKTLLVPLWKAAGFNITRDKLTKLIKTAAGVLRQKIKEKVKQAFSYHSIRFDNTFSYSGRVRLERHLNVYVSGTGSVRQEPSELDQ